MSAARLSIFAAWLVAIARVASTQGTVPVPDPQIPSQRPVDEPSSGVYGSHGTPQPVELREITSGGGFVRRAVRTRGVLTGLDQKGEYFELADSGARVVLIPVQEFGDGLRALRGHRVEVVGLVRALGPKQGTCTLPNRQVAPQSYCVDPHLPPTPDLTGEKAEWPNLSITAWTVLDISPLDWRRGGAERGSLADFLETPPPVTTTVKVLGRFCGAGLCGGLSDPPEPTAWVLQDREVAVWIIGKPPKGKGWRLDPTYAGDTSRWIEVAGKLVPCGTGRCLRAESLVLAPRPEPSP